MLIWRFQLTSRFDIVLLIISSDPERSGIDYTDFHRDLIIVLVLAGLKFVSDGENQLFFFILEL